MRLTRCLLRYGGCLLPSLTGKRGVAAPSSGKKPTPAPSRPHLAQARPLTPTSKPVTLSHLTSGLAYSYSPARETTNKHNKVQLPIPGANVLDNGHITLKIPVLVRSLQSNSAELGQYLDGRPPGNTKCCCQRFRSFLFFRVGFLFLGGLTKASKTTSGPGEASLSHHRLLDLPPRQRPYHVENTSSRPITEVKQR